MLASLPLVASLISAAFGAPGAGLELAVDIDAKGTTATFHIRNTGTLAVTFAQEYSCSGLSHFSISTGPSKARLDTHFHHEPKVKGMTSTPTTTCTRNGPIKLRTVRPGKTVSITIPFAKRGAILARNHKVFRANALLTAEGRAGFVHLHSAFATR